MKNGLPHIIAMKGFSNSGKTTSLESIITLLTKNRKKTAVIKHIHQENFSIDQPGKDTWKMREAGGDPIVSYSNNEIAFLTNKKMDISQTIQLLLKIRDNLDYIFLEGFWDNCYPKILFFKNLDEFEQLIKQILGHPSGNEILLTTFCLSGLFFVSPSLHKTDLLDLYAKLHKQKIINTPLKMHLQSLPGLNIKNNPKKLLEVYNSFSLVKKNL